MEHQLQAARHILFQLRFRHRRLLKIEHVEEPVPEQLVHGHGWRHRGGTSIGNRHADERIDTLWVSSCHLPGQPTSPVMGYQDGTVITQGIDQADDVFDQLAVTVGSHVFGATGIAITTQIRGHGVVTRLSEHRQLIAPGSPALRKPVQAQHQWLTGLTRFCHKEFKAVGGHLSLLRKCHTLFLI